MRKRLLSIFVTTFAFQTYAQITITSTNTYKVGEIHPTQPINRSSFTLSPAGANVNVDYSTVTKSDSSYFIPVINPRLTSWGNKAPAANAAIFGSLIAGSDTSLFYLYKIDANGVDEVGFYNQYDETEQELEIIYSDPKTIRKFPFAFGNTYTDEFKGKSTPLFGLSTVVRRTGSINVMADAHGTITTPSGTFPYLRLKTVEVVVDSTFIDDEIFAERHSYVRTTYEYYSNKRVMPVFSLSDYEGKLNSSTAVYDMSSNITTSINLNETKDIVISVYPNPIEDEITIGLNGLNKEKCEVSIYNITGQLVHSQLADIKQNNRIKFDARAWNKGVYFVKIKAKTSGQIITQKFIKN